MLLQSGAIKYAYDVAGNMIAKELPDGKKWRYEWSRAGHLKTVETPDGKKVSFEYDALGRRVSKKVGDTTTRWMWSGNVPIHEWREREGDDGGPDDVATTWVFEPDTFVPVAKITSDGKRKSIISDYLGTPKEMRDEAGELAWKAQLDIYGVATVEEGKRDDCPWRWQGQYEDVETGLYYNRFRYYDPVRGDYISQDPIRLLGGMRMYGYVEDPLRQIDVLGLTSCTDTTVRHGPTNPGPLPSNVANTFRGGSYNATTLANDTLLYRVHGGSAGPIGSYWTRIAPSGPVQAQLDLALVPSWGNNASKMSIIRVPAGTTIFEGFAAPQASGLGGQLLGGGNQVFIPHVNPGWLVSQ